MSIANLSKIAGYIACIIILMCCYCAATSDTDFTELSAEVLDVVLTFDDGQRRGCFEVQIVNDNVVENVETFYVELKFIRQFNQSGVVLQPNMANITIIDDGKYLF